MPIYVANPLYDAVFKYLMEDERIARTILSALLKKKVRNVKMRRHEYSAFMRKRAISMFRIDFSAEVEDENGQSQLTLIELQKTWLPTETLRFRRYLALQYNNEENMLKEENGKFAMPMVAVYLLGHRVGHIKDPVVYVRHQAYNYENKEVTQGMPDKFVESLQHDSIIVQIPLLRGQMNNRLEQVLSIFNQEHTADSKMMIMIDDQIMEGDEDMEYVVRRLKKAASDPKVRYQMNIEDEYFKELGSRDSAIHERDEKIKEQDARIMEQGAQLKEQGAQLKEQGAQLKEQGAQLKEQGAQLKEQGAMLYTMISSLMESGKTLADIAAMLGKSEDEIQQIISSQQ